MQGRKKKRTHDAPPQTRGSSLVWLYSMKTRQGMLPRKNVLPHTGLLLLGLFGMCILSCRPEVDDIPPTLTVNFPSDGATYDVLDTIVVSVDVTDNEAVRFVLTELITADGQLVLPGHQEAVCSNGASLTFGYPVDDIHIESGDYYLRISADDGTQKRTAFIELSLFEVPLSFDAYYWIQDGGGGPVLQRRNATDLQLEVCTEVAQGLHKLYPDRWSQRLVMANSSGTHLQFVDVADCETLNEVTFNLALPGSHAGHFDYGDRLFYSAATGDQIRVFRTNGTQISALPFPEDIAVSAIGCLEDDVVLAGSFNGNHFVFFINKNSGALQHTVAFDDPVTALITESLSETIVVYTSSAEGATGWRLEGTESTTLLDIEPTAAVRGAEWQSLLPGSQLVLLLEDGRIFTHTPWNQNDPGSEVNAPVFVADDFGIDWTSDDVYYTSDGSVFFSQTPAAPIYPLETATNSLPTGLGLMYNK